MLKVAALR